MVSSQKAKVHIIIMLCLWLCELLIQICKWNMLSVIWTLRDNGSVLYKWTVFNGKICIQLLSVPYERQPYIVFTMMVTWIPAWCSTHNRTRFRYSYECPFGKNQYSILQHTTYSRPVETCRFNSNVPSEYLMHFWQEKVITVKERFLWFTLIVLVKSIIQSTSLFNWNRL